MPAVLAARLYRVLPLIVIFAIIAVAVFVFMSWRYTTARAKEALIQVFTILGIVSSAFFLLATLYALLEGNSFVTDFFLTCLIFTLIVLGIALLCHWRFLKKNPNYRWRLTGHVKKFRRKH